MKNIFSIITILFICQTSFAKDGPFISASLNWSDANHKFDDRLKRNNANRRDDGVSTDNQSSSFSVSAGYKKFIDNNIYIAPEIFYDHLNTRAIDFNCTKPTGAFQGSCDDLFKLNHRFGAKVNFGYELNQKFGVFANVGLSAVNWDILLINETSPNNFKSSQGNEENISYGFGLSYNVTENIFLRGSFDIQKFDLDYDISRNTGDGFAVETTLKMYKFGVGYIF